MPATIRPRFHVTASTLHYTMTIFLSCVDWDERRPSIHLTIMCAGVMKRWWCWFDAANITTSTNHTFIHRFASWMPSARWSKVLTSETSWCKSEQNKWKAVQCFLISSFSRFSHERTIQRAVWRAMCAAAPIRPNQRRQTDACLTCSRCSDCDAHYVQPCVVTSQAENFSFLL